MQLSVAALAAATGLFLFSSPLFSQEKMEIMPVHYLCDRGVEVAATYVNAQGEAAAVLDVEGRQVALIVEPSASGARYGWPSDGSHYVWWTKGPEATLYWRDGETRQEAEVLGNCRQED